MILPHAALWLVAALATACAGTPTAPTPSPTPSAGASPAALPSVVPSALPSAPVSALPSKQAFFGAVTDKRTVTETVIIVRAGENPAAKTYGLATMRYVTVEGVEHAVHWDHATVHDALTLGESVNVHPTDQVVGKKDAQGVETFRTLMKLYRGSRRIDPIEVIF